MERIGNSPVSTVMKISMVIIFMFFFVTCIKNKIASKEKRGKEGETNRVPFGRKRKDGRRKERRREKT